MGKPTVITAGRLAVLALKSTVIPAVFATVAEVLTPELEDVPLLAVVFETAEGPVAREGEGAAGTAACSDMATSMPALLEAFAAALLTVF